MKREDVKAIFPNATDEEITKILNAHNGELATERAATKKAIGERDGLQAQIDKAADADKTDLELLQGQIEALNKQMGDLSAENISLKRTTALAKIGITGEDADKLLASLGGENVDFSTLGDILVAREKAAVAAAEKKWLEDTPGGGHGAEGNKEGADVIFAKSVSFGESNTDAASVLGKY